MERGKLSEIQRDEAWRAQDPADRAAMSALANLDPEEESPEQAAFRKRLEKIKDDDANFSRGGIAEDVGRIATNAKSGAAFDAKTANRKRQEKKQVADTQMLLVSLDAAQDFADQRAADAARYEAGFEEKFGDAWREEIANRVMDPDEIPERLPGESIEDYRARLEDELIETMIDPATGEMKPEYRNDPAIRQYGLWAEARFDVRESLDYIERRSKASGNPERQHEIDENYAASATGREARVAQQESHRNGDKIETLEARTDELMENVATVENEGGFADPAP